MPRMIPRQKYCFPAFTPISTPCTVFAFGQTPFRTVQRRWNFCWLLLTDFLPKLYVLADNAYLSVRTSTAVGVSLTAYTYFTEAYFMRKWLPLLFIVWLANCQSASTKSSGKPEAGPQKLWAFQSADRYTDSAIQKAINYLEAKKIPPDSFYVINIKKEADSIKLILFHHDLIAEIKARKRNPNDQWVVLPPLSAMPDMAQELTYLVEDDSIIDNLAKQARILSSRRVSA